MLNLNDFISRYVVKRKESMFLSDINNNHDILSERINGKSILVIGGAGSIGSSFIRNVLPFKPRSLVIVDINENALAETTRDLRSTAGMYVCDDFVTYPMDFASGVFEKMFRSRKGFDIVANFSAYKHVRTEKDIYSIESLIRNNVLNAKKLLDLLSEFPPENFFCVSTDKAANPVNIMGASKRIMEDVIFSYSDRYPVKTARFANVAFSNGSLPLGFIERIGKLQPLSAPLDVKRYFVSPKESGEICMLSAMLGNNREIFFPKLSEAQMMSFDEIASQLLKEYGYNVLRCATETEALEKAESLKNGGNDYPVIFSKSDTSGEKLFEEFFVENESVDMDRFLSLGVIIDKKIPADNEIDDLYNELNELFNRRDITKADIVKAIKNYLPDFEHIETGKSLDSKM